MARWLVRLGPMILTGGLVVYGLLQTCPATVWLLVLSAAVLTCAGAGIGLAFPTFPWPRSAAATNPARAKRPG
jgi:hypothetical protein